ncbi:PIN domain-like protein [Artomyces pyxidatus]|uniref:PIN domain-like protein n=1 Tax=Artomyces pyxidatus TaxID=48021 RepID=A0ACB8SNB3_9AGAM|nr:PIN domain-like protein [Artomyces pyxidatus]
MVRLTTVPGLWKVPNIASQTTTLAELALRKGFSPATSPAGYVLGVDASLWILESYIRNDKNQHTADQDALHTIYSRLERLYEAPVTPLFVFDGPPPALHERAELVHRYARWLEPGMQQFLAAFGFQHYMAPSDAHAELARLNKEGVVDAVMTTAPEVLIYGARAVVRSTSANSGPVIFYDVDGATASSPHLSCGGLMLAVLIKQCLPDCDTKAAVAIARYGSGDVLLHAARTLNAAALEQFLTGWREELRAQLAHDPRRLLDRPRPGLAASNLIDVFPDNHLLLRYARPLTSWSLAAVPPRMVPVEPPRADLITLTVLHTQYFGWQGPDVLAQGFRRAVWPGTCMRQIWATVSMTCCPCKMCVPGASQGVLVLAPPHSFLDLHVKVFKRVQEQPHAEYDIEFSTVAYMHLALAALGLLPPSPSPPPPPSPDLGGHMHLRMRVPATLLDLAYPQLPSLVRRHSGEGPIFVCNSAVASTASGLSPQAAQHEVIDLTHEDDDASLVVCR